MKGTVYCMLKNLKKRKFKNNNLENSMKVSEQLIGIKTIRPDIFSVGTGTTSNKALCVKRGVAMQDYCLVSIPII